MAGPLHFYLNSLDSRNALLTFAFRIKQFDAIIELQTHLQNAMLLADRTYG